MHLVGALMPLIEAGRIKVYSCDNLAGRAFASRTGSVEYRCALLNRFQDCIAEEVVPAIRADCRDASAEVVAAGASLGAFMAVAVACRYPWAFRAAVGMSGTYDLERLFEFKGNRGLLLRHADELPAEPRLGRAPRRLAPALRGPRLRRRAVGEPRRQLAPGRGPREQAASRTGSTPGGRSTTTTGRPGGRCCRSTSTTWWREPRDRREGHPHAAVIRTVLPRARRAVRQRLASAEVPAARGLRLQGSERPGLGGSRRRGGRWRFDPARLLDRHRRALRGQLPERLGGARPLLPGAHAHGAGHPPHFLLRDAGDGRR